MEMIQGAEWVAVAIFLMATLAGLFLVVSAQGDMNLREESGGKRRRSGRSDAHRHDQQDAKQFSHS